MPSVGRMPWPAPQGWACSIFDAEFRGIAQLFFRRGGGGFPTRRGRPPHAEARLARDHARRRHCPHSFLEFTFLLGAAVQEMALASLLLAVFGLSASL